MHLAGLHLVVCVVLAQAPPAAQPPQPLTKVLVLGVTGKGGVDAEMVSQTNVLIAQAISAHPGYRVTTLEDVKDLAKLAKDRELLGTGGQDLARLSDAARGVDASAIITGTLVRTGDNLILTLQRVDVSSMAVKGATASLERTKEIPDAVQRLAMELMGLPSQAARPQYRLPDGRTTSFAVMDLTASGVKADVVANLTQVLSAEIKKIENTTVVSRADIQAMLQMEATKALAGCDQESCLAEIGGALGVEKLVAGSVGRLGDSYVVSLRLIAVDNVLVESRATESFTGSEDQLLHAIRQAARTLLGLESDDKGALTVTASQAGASVLVDGKQAGIIPLAPLGELKAGAHTVEIEKPGYARWVGDAYIHPNETTAVWVNLEPLPPRFYQRPIFWAAVIASSSAAMTVPLSIVAAGALGSLVIMRLYLSDPPPGTGSATIQETP